MSDIFEFLNHTLSLKDPIDLFMSTEDPIDLFMSTVANQQMTMLTKIPQPGNFYQQTMYAHLLNVVLAVDLATKADIAECNPLERKILICAIFIYNINKLPPEDQNTYGIPDSRNIDTFLKYFGLDQVLEPTEKNIASIKFLLANYSNQFPFPSETFLPHIDPILLHRLKAVLLPLLKLAENLDKARSFNDPASQEVILDQRNTISEKKFRWEWHRLNEYRGPFSNLLYNAVSQELQSQCNARPFLCYGEGTFYLVPATAPSTLAPDTIDRIAKHLSVHIKRLKDGCVKDFINSSPTGMKINKEIFHTTISLQEAFETASVMIAGRVFKTETIADMDQKAQNRAEKGYQVLLDDTGHLFSFDPDIMRKGEALRLAYNFLQAHCAVLFKGKKKLYTDAWQVIFAKCGIISKPEWALIQPLYDQAYVVARSVLVSFDQLISQITAMVSSFEASLKLRKTSTSVNPVLCEYVKNVLTLSQLRTPLPQFYKHLELYSDPSSEACSLCGLPFSAQPMMAGDVPKKLAVAQFSNRNPAGSKEPKRNSCPICREQLFVERIGFSPATSKGFYLHIYPESFAPPLFLEALRITFRELQGREIKAILFDTRAITRELDQTHTLKLPFTSKSTGLVIPNYSELVGNIITLPIYALGNNDTERYLFALQYALYIQRRFGQRVVLTQSLVPPVGIEEMMETQNGDGIKLYCDNLPGSLSGLIPQNALSGSDTNKVFQLLFWLKSLADKIGIGDDLVDLVRALTKGELEVFLVAHRAIERNSKTPNAANYTGGQIVDRLKQVSNLVAQRTRGEHPMPEPSLTTTLESMAELAWKRSIRGSSLNHTALIKPLDIIFQTLRRQPDLEPELLRLTTQELILRHIERISDYALSAERSAAVGNWTAIFFNDLLTNHFSGNIRRVLRDEKTIKAAYTTLMRSQLTKASEAKKQLAAQITQ